MCLGFEEVGKGRCLKSVNGFCSTLMIESESDWDFAVVVEVGLDLKAMRRVQFLESWTSVLTW